MIADILIDIDIATVEDMRGILRPMLASIMRHDLELDRLRGVEISIIKDEADARLKVVQDELEAIGVEIEQLEIQTALSKLCRAENLDPSVV